MERFLVLLCLLGCGPAHVTETTPDPDPEPTDEVVSAAGYLPEGFEERPRVAHREGAEGATGGPVFPSIRGQVSQVRWAPTGEGVVVMTTDRVVALIDPRDGALRAARRVAVRYDDAVWLGSFDETGTRLLVTVTQYPIVSTYVWDLRTNEWTLAARSDDEQATTSYFVGDRVVLMKPSELSVIDPGGDTRAIELSLTGRNEINAAMQRSRPAADGRTLLVQAGDSVRFIDLDAGAERAIVQGELEDVRETGGLISIVQEEGTRLVDEEGEPRALLRDAVARFARDGSVIVDEPQGARRIVDPRTGEVLAQGERSEPTLEWDDGTLAYGPDAAGRVLLKREGIGGEPQSLLELWPEGAPPPFDDVTGIEAQIRGVAVSPDGSAIAIGSGDAVSILDAATGRPRANFAIGAGERSVWGVVPGERSFVVWGRGWAHRWTASGLKQTRCAGEGSIVTLGDDVGIVTPYQACLGDVKHELGEDELENLFIGTHGDQLAQRVGDRLHLRDFRSGRVRARFRLPPDLELYCENNCSASYYPLGRRAGVLVDATQDVAWLLGTGRPRQLGEVASYGSRAAGERFLAVGEEEAKIYDARGRVVFETPGTQFALGEDALAMWHEGELAVVSLPAGTERMRAPLEERPLRLELFGDAVLTRDEAGGALWNVATGAVSFRIAGDDPAVFEDGSHAVTCEGGRLAVRRIADGTTVRTLGSCALAESFRVIDATATPDASAEGGVRLSGAVAVDAVTVVRVHPLEGGEPLVVRTSGTRAVASRGEKLWCAPDALDGLRFRAPGPLATASIDDARGHYDADLLQGFFASLQP